MVIGASAGPLKTEWPTGISYLLISCPKALKGCRQRIAMAVNVMMHLEKFFIGHVLCLYEGKNTVRVKTVPGNEG
jgi:hypothetical protein